MVLQRVGHQPVRDVLVGHAAHGRDLGPGGETDRGPVLGVDVNLQVREEEGAQVLDAREALRGDRLEQEGDPVGAEVGGRGRQAEERDGVGAEVAPTLQHQDLDGELEGAGHYSGDGLGGRCGSPGWIWPALLQPWLDLACVAAGLADLKPTPGRPEGPQIVSNRFVERAT
jgi:hypothetical protein